MCVQLVPFALVIALASAQTLVVSCPVAPGIQCLAVSFSYSGTGPGAGLAAAMANGYTLWAQTVNSGQGIDNPLTGLWKIALYAADDSGNPATCEANYNKFIANKDDFLLGPLGDELSAVAQSVAATAGAVLVQSTAVVPAAYNTSMNTYVYGVQTMANYYTGTSIQQLRQSTGMRTVYTVTRTDSVVSTEIAWGATQYIAQAGFTVVGQGTYTAQSLQGSAASLMASVKQANPDALFIFGHHWEVEMFINELRAISFTPKALLAPLSVGDPNFVSDIGAAANGVIGSLQWSSTLPSNGFTDDGLFENPAAYAALYQKTFGMPVNEIAAAASAAGYALGIGIKTAAGTTPRMIGAALRGMTIPSVYGTLRFNSTSGSTGGENIGKIMFGAQVQSGNVALVAPPTYATGSIQYPMPPFPPLSPASPHGHELSTGSILVIIFFVLLFVYCVVGVIYKGTQGARGLEMVPNIKLWRRVPGLIGDGFLFTWTIVTCRHRKAVNYETISS